MKKKKSKKVHKCLQCEVVPCINLYKKDGRLEGGEFYVLEKCLDRKKYTFCECGSIVYALCQLSKEFTDTLSFELFNQCIRDLKAATFLIFAGHYRTAIQILRPVIENWLVGLYWDFKFMTSGGKNNIVREYEKFRRQENYEIPHDEWIEIFREEANRKRKRYLSQEVVLRWLLKREVIDGKFKQEINEMSGKLNKYLHPAFPMTDIKRKGCTKCPASVKFTRKEYTKCIKLFQDTAVLLLGTFYKYVEMFLPEKINSKEVKDAFGFIISLQDIEKEAERKLVISAELRRFINEIEATKSDVG